MEIHTKVMEIQRKVMKTCDSSASSSPASSSPPHSFFLSYHSPSPPTASTFASVIPCSRRRRNVMEIHAKVIEM